MTHPRWRCTRSWPGNASRVPGVAVLPARTRAASKRERVRSRGGAWQVQLAGGSPRGDAWVNCRPARHTSGDGRHVKVGRRGMSRTSVGRHVVGSKTAGARSRLKGHGPSQRASRPVWLAPLLIGGAAAVLLFWNLTDTYLWQDEANTAVLAVRLLRHGKPLAYDGRNLISDDNYAAMD